MYDLFLIYDLYSLCMSCYLHVVLVDFIHVVGPSFFFFFYLKCELQPRIPLPKASS
jgi:hypothetical protein